MTEKRNRRSFLKGAALVGAAAALPSATPSSALAQGRGIPLAPPPANDTAPEDKADELAPLVQAAVAEAMGRADKVLEKLIRSPTPARSVNVGSSLAAQGLQLRSPGAQKYARTNITNLELIRKKAQEGKTTGWHTHICWVSIPVVGCIVHSHATW